MYYKQMDGLRCLCVVGVMFQHFVHPAVSRYFLTAIAGVDLFFVISGFLITENLLKLKEKYDFNQGFKTFYMRRILRIFPLYYLYWGILALFFFNEYREIFSWGLLYGVNFYLIYFNVDHYLAGHLWSLAVEEQFYLIWPFFILLCLYKNIAKYTKWLIAIGLIYSAWNLFAHNDYNYNYMHPLSCAIALLTGALLAVLKKDNFEKFASLSRYTGIATVIFVVGMLATGYLCARGLPEEYKLSVRILTCILGIAVIPAITTNPIKGWMGKLLSSKAAAYVGKISYGVYIYHILVFYLLRPHVEKAYAAIFSSSSFDKSVLRYVKYNPTLFEFPFYSLAVIAVASVSYYVFEVRFLNLKNKFQ